MLTRTDIVEILSDVEYLDWEFKVGYFNDDHGLNNSPIYLQVKFFDSEGKEWGGRKWHISRYSTKDEIVQTALKAVLTAIEHEAREAFLYKGVPVFGPHHSLDDLLKIQESKRVEV